MERTAERTAKKQGEMDAFHGRKEETLDASNAEVNGTVNPMELKKKVAKNIVRQYHDQAAADEAEAFFYRQVQQKGFDDKAFTPVALSDIFAGNAEMTLIDVCAKLNPAESKSALRRLIESGAVSINGDKQTDPYFKVSATQGTKFKIGKRGFFELA